MRSRPAIAVLLLSLLAACADTGCLSQSSSNALSACVGAAITSAPPINDRIAERGVAYTELGSQPRQVEVIPVRIDTGFTDADRATIEHAVAEWNHVLNGHVRLEIGEAFNAGPTPTPYVPKDPKTWFIGRVGGPGGFESGQGIKKNPFSRALAQTHELANGGQLVLVFSDRVGQRDLNGILLHEMGHALGLGHDGKGQLMHAHYASSRQQCVDRAAVQALASSRGLPFGELNWCGKASDVNTAMAATRSSRFVAQASK